MLHVQKLKDQKLPNVLPKNDVWLLSCVILHMFWKVRHHTHLIIVVGILNNAGFAVGTHVNTRDCMCSSCVCVSVCVCKYVVKKKREYLKIWVGELKNRIIKLRRYILNLYHSYDGMSCNDPREEAKNWSNLVKIYNKI